MPKEDGRKYEMLSLDLRDLGKVPLSTVDFLQSPGSWEDVSEGTRNRENDKMTSTWVKNSKT